MIWLKICIALLYIHLTYSSNFCRSENSCKCELSSGEGVIDLSDVGIPESPRFYDVLFENNCSSKLYSYNPCFPFDSSDKLVQTPTSLKPCIGAAACIKTPGGTEGQPSWEHAIGLQYTSVFGSYGSDIHINYTVPGTAKILQVVLICKNDSTKHLLSAIEPECNNSFIVLSLTSRCACPNGSLSVSPDSPSAGGLSTGSILLMVFFTFLLAYLIVGITWNFCNGGAGIELLPNLEFWSELPTLIMDYVASNFHPSICEEKTISKKELHDLRVGMQLYARSVKLRFLDFTKRNGFDKEVYNAYLKVQQDLEPIKRELAHDVVYKEHINGTSFSLAESNQHFEILLKHKIERKSE